MRVLAGVFSLSILCVAVGALPCLAVDLSGKWNLDGEIVVVNHSGSSLSFIAGGIPFSGTVEAGTPFSTYVVSGAPGFPIQITGRVMPSGDLLDARGTSGTPPDLFTFGTYARRCGCDDGNSVDGDGCDAECQVEPCWSCSGDPATCVPSPQGAMCEDGSVCTAGETCSEGVCGGGDVISPCFDMSGNWSHRQEVPSLAISSSEILPLEQFGTDVVSDRYVGTIDPATGNFDLRASSPIAFLACSAPFDTLVGSMAADGLSYEAEGSYQDYDPSTPEFCFGYAMSGRGSRCGNGAIDAGEQCDDGNGDAGDGCDAGCARETCWSCEGEPSLCVAAPRAPCAVSLAPRRSLLAIKNRDDAAKNRITWRWKKGNEVPPASLGNPIAEHSYEICVYDESGPEPRLAFAAAVPGGELCGGLSCWKQRGEVGFAYARKSGPPEGGVGLRIRAGEAGRPAVGFKGRGIHLGDRPAGLPAPPLAMPLRVQLRGGIDLCVESVHTAESVIRNDAAQGVFKARGAQR